MNSFEELLKQLLPQQKPVYQPTAIDQLTAPKPQAEVTAYEPTLRQRGQQAVQGLLENIGYDRGYSRGVSQSLLGGPSSTLPMDMGLADVVPGLGYLLGAEDSMEGVKSAKKSLDEGNLGSAALEYGLSSLGLLPAGLGTMASSKGAKQLDKSFGDRVTKFGDMEFDPRFDPRANEQQKLKDTTTIVQQTSDLNAPTVPLTDFEGYPFITSMADRTAAGGLLTSINDVDLKRPVELPGGQDYMFTTPDKVWASGNQPVKQLMQYAGLAKQATGKNPIYLPYRMAPTGGDFATMTGETMLSYAESALPKSAKKPIDKAIKEIAPNWKGIDSPESRQQFQNYPDKVRKKIKQSLDVNFRNLGGLSIGQARLSVADPKQLSAKEGEIMNIGRIFADKPIIQESGHPSYPKGVPGEGLARVDRNIGIFELLDDAVKVRNIADPKSPSPADLRALQMHPYAGLLTSDILKRLGY